MGSREATVLPPGSVTTAVPVRVLMVEHNPADVELCLAELRRSGLNAQADVVQNREEFLDRLRANFYDIVLSDYRLPQWTGLDALDLLKESGFDTPFILVTGTIGEEGAVEAMKQGVTDYVLKDRIQRLSVAVRRALDERASQVARVRAEEALRRSETRYRSLVENATYGVCFCGADGHFLTVNPALLRMLGYTAVSEVLALDLDGDVFVDPSARERYLTRLGEVDRIPAIEVEWKRKDGTQVTVRLTGRAVRDPSGLLSGYELFAEDISARWVIEERTRQMQKMEAMGELTGGIAHDFNNLLTIISANAELIEHELPDNLSDLRSELAELKAAARRGSAMVRKLLTFSRETEIQLGPVDIVGLTLEVGSLLRRLLPESIEIHTEAGNEEATIMGDPGAIEQALINLGTNARDAMPNGGRLEIAVRRMSLDDSYLNTLGASVGPGNYACVSVNDNGAGMDERTKQKIFEPFFTTKPPNQGTGLGMAMVYGIVRHHNGFINVYSELRKGTTIRIYFPLALDSAKEIKLEQPPKPRGGSETILVVEDEDMIRSSARRILERYGYKVLVAADGEEALGLLRAGANQVNLVISDVIMPRLSGRQLFEAVMRERIPVRFMYTSGYTALDARETATLDQNVPLLPKPWVVADLLNRIRAVLDA
jgi:hypothetical protein